MCHEQNPAPVRGGSGIREEQVTVAGADQPVPAFLVWPDSDDAAPAALVIHDIHGANAFYHDLARRLAAEGFLALLPDLFIRQGPVADPTPEAIRARASQLDQALAITDLAAALDLLRTHPAATGRVGTVGFCLGGTLVMLLAAAEAAPEASVAFYGFPVRATTALAPRMPMDEAAAMRSPLLAFWGDQDAGVGMDNVEAYRSALAAGDARHEFVIYPGYPHGFLTFDPAAPTFDGSRDAWDRTLTFLRAELSG